MTFVEVHSVSKNFAGKTALEKISLGIGENELFGLIGPDGAGKTTLFRIITSLLLPDEGSVLVGGYDTVRDYRLIRKMTGYMPGRFSLYHDLSVEENLKFYATVFGTTLKKNYALIKDIYFPLEPFRNRLAGKLSGGMKQKLALACALIHHPALLVLDEPTTGVDAISRKEFWVLLRRLKEKGITIVVSTPYMDEAMNCDRVALIQEGNIMQVDTPAGITGSYPGKIFAVRGESLFDLLRFLRQHPSVVQAFMFGNELHFRLKESRTQTEDMVYDILAAAGGKYELTLVEPGMEDCFVHLMDKRSVSGKTEKGRQ